MIIQIVSLLNKHGDKIIYQKIDIQIYIQYWIIDKT